VAGIPGLRRGYMLDSGVHFIALLRKIVGEVEEVSASVSQRVPYLPPADSATAILSFDTTHHIGDMMNWTQI
jgi:predicted dehydrogenase